VTRAAELRAAAPGRRLLRDPAPWLWIGVIALALVQAAALDVGDQPLRAAARAVLPIVVLVRGRARWVDRDDVRGRRWLVVLGAAQVVLAVWAVQSFARALPAGVGEPSGFYRVKVLVSTPLGDHNTAAGLLLVGVVATVVLAQEDRRWWAGVVLTTAGVVACLSRGAALVLLVVGLASFAPGVRRPVAAATTAVAAVALVLVSVLAVGLDASPPAGAAVPDGPLGTSVVGRVDLAERGVALLVEHPALGVGLGGFGDHAEGLPPPNDHAHNTFAQAGAEGGVTYLLLTAGVVLLLAWRGWHQPVGWRRDVTLLGGAALVTHGLIDVLSGLVGNELLLAVLLALAAPRPEGATGRR
jgi:hypothetical protein